MGLSDWMKGQLKSYDIKAFYYIIAIDNLPSVMEYGINSKNEVESRGKRYLTFADENVQNRRHGLKVYLSDKKWHNIHDLVPVYLTPLTPTLFARKEKQDRLCVITINPSVICDTKISYVFSDGNAASRDTVFDYNLRNLNMIDWNIIREPYWTQYHDGTRRRNAEFLIFPRILPVWFLSIVFQSESSLKKGIESIGNNDLLKIEPNCFF